MENKSNHKKGYAGFHRVGKVLMSVAIPFSAVGVTGTVLFAVFMGINLAKVAETQGETEAALATLFGVCMGLSIAVLSLGIFILAGAVAFVSIANGMRHKDEAAGIDYQDMD